jgi:hypothetical protein
MAAARRGTSLAAPPARRISSSPCWRLVRSPARRGVLVGTGAKVLDTIEIGKHAEIANASSILTPVPADTPMAGVPAKTFEPLPRPISAPFSNSSRLCRIEALIMPSSSSGTRCPVR